MVHRREIAGREVVFGNHGALYGNAMTWWDHETGSVWSQPRGEAIIGDLKGHRLELVASTLSHWSAWKEAHPETLAIDAWGFPMVVGLDDLAFVVDLGAETVAYEYQEVVSSGGVINDSVAGVELAVVVDPTNEQRWAVFSRRLDEAVVELRIVEGTLLDIATQTIFDPVRGSAVEGPLRGQVMDLLPATTIFPKDFATFWPDGRLHGDKALP